MKNMTSKISQKPGGKKYRFEIHQDGKMILESGFLYSEKMAQKYGSEKLKNWNNWNKKK